LYSGESDWAGTKTPGQRDTALHATLPVLDRLADIQTLLLLVATVVAVLLLLRLVRAAVFFTAGLAVMVLAPLLKEAFDRPSPFPQPDDPSFPSGHAIGSMAIAAGIVALLFQTRWRWASLVAAAVFVLAVGVAVIADGGHWPSDVVAGWCLSLAWVTGLRAAFGDPLGQASRHRAQHQPVRQEANLPPRASPARRA
jgi:undecaprenyl-diphosphatase